MHARVAVTAFLLLSGVGVPGATPAPPPAAAAAGGAEWLATLQATQGFDKLSAFANGTFYAQYMDSYARSRDFGKTWQVMPRPPRQSLGSPGIRFATPTLGYSVAGGDADLLASDPADQAEQVRRCGGISPLNRTVDGGATWQFVCVPRTGLTSDPRFTTDASPLAVHPGGRSLLLTGEEHPLKPAATGGCGTEQTVIYTSHTGGTKWVRATLPRGWAAGYRHQILDPSTIAHLAYRFEKGSGSCSSSTTGLFVSRDGGRSFKNVHVCRTGSPCTAVAMLTRSRILLGRADGSTLVSADGGRTWRAGRRLTDARWDPASSTLAADSFWVQSFSFADARHGFASTRGNGTWRTADGGRSWTQERSHECAWYLPGVGEIAAASPTQAITGGPHFISARVESPAPPTGCAPSPQHAPAPAATVAAFAVGPVRYTLRADGGMTRST